MIKILDLFSGTQSVKKSITKLFGVDEWICDGGVWSGKTFRAFDIESGDYITIVQYIGIDIYDPEDENLIFDLTQDNVVKELIKALPKDWKPDFIWASPVCNKLSLATAMKGGHNAYFKLDKENKTIEPWPIGSNVDGAKNYQGIVGSEKALKEALFTLKMFDNTKKIIKYFNIPFAIENPRHSLTRYIMKDYVMNNTSYCMYGFKQQKNTTIFSNKTLNLLKCNHKRGSHSVGVYGKAKHKNKTLVGCYADRAAVPSKLIQEIIKQTLEGEQHE